MDVPNTIREFMQMTPAQKKDLATKAKEHSLTGLIILGVITVLFQFGIIGPDREASLIETQQRFALLERGTEANERRVDALERIMDVRLGQIQSDVGEIKTELRALRNVSGYNPYQTPQGGRTP